jgi:hypothetical protein
MTVGEMQAQLNHAVLKLSVMKKDGSTRDEVAQQEKVCRAIRDSIREELFKGDSRNRR